MNEIKVCINFTELKSKPDCEQMNRIKRDMVERIFTINQNNMRSFVKFIGRSECSFIPATFDVSFFTVYATREIFGQMQMFVLEFNGNITLEEVINRAKQYELPILFAYDPVDGINQNQFRVVFLNDLPIKYVQVAEIMIEALLNIFPEADTNCKDVTKIYLGGKKILYFDESMNPFNVESLFRNLCLYFKDRYGNTHYHRKIIDFSNKTGLALNKNKYFDVSIIAKKEQGELDSSIYDLVSNKNNGNFSTKSIIYIIENVHKLPFRDTTYNKDIEYVSNIYKIVINKSNYSSDVISNIHLVNKTTKSENKFRSYNLPMIESECNLIKEFKKGTQILQSKELLGVSSNLIHVEAGSNMILDTLKKYSYFDNSKRYSDWSFYLNYMKKNEYECLSCNTFCPYKDHCHHSSNILSTVKPKYHSVIELQNTYKESYSLNQAVSDLQIKFNQVIREPKHEYLKNIHIINSSTGVGKSSTVLNYVKNHPECKLLIGTPTIDLKNMYYTTAILNGINVIKTPSLMEYKDDLPEAVWDHIQELYQIGKYSTAFEYIKSITSQKLVDEKTSKLLSQYLNEMKRIWTFNGTIFTTHNMIAAMNYSMLQRFDAVIFDEDPLLNYMVASQVEIPVAKLRDVLSEIDSKSKLEQKIHAVLKAIENKSWFEVPQIHYNEKYDSIQTKVNIPDFCMAEKFYYREATENNNIYKNSPKENSIVFLKALKLHPRIKYIILSATASVKVYNRCFGGKQVCLHECKDAEYIGTLNQYTFYPVSKAFIKQNPNIVKKMIKIGGTDNIITFEGEEYGVNDCHFGKTTGINTYEGKDLTIIGTYHRPEWLYKLFVYTINGSLFDIHKDAAMSYQPVEYNGCKFRFMTFDKSHEALRDIQFWMIESELEQAIGRARLTRCKCTVNVFSNFPLKRAKINNIDYK